MDFYLDTEGFWGLGGGWKPISDRIRLRDFAMPGGLDEYFVSPAYLYRYYLMDGAINNRDQALLQQYLNDWDVVLRPGVCAAHTDDNGDDF